MLYCNLGKPSVLRACFLPTLALTHAFIGSDSVVHISEEVEDASLTVPRVMWWSFWLNLVLGIVILITMLFCIGTLDDALNAEIPYLALFQNTGSNAVAFVLLIILFILIFLGNITCLATVAREVWAFSRDHGFPFSHWISQIEMKYHVPFNAGKLSKPMRS